VRAYGAPVRAGIGGAGVEVPIESPTSNPALAAAREQRRIVAIEAAETAAAARQESSGRKPARRSAGSEIWTLPSVNNRPLAEISDRPQGELTAPAPAEPGPAVEPVVPSPRQASQLTGRTISQLRADLMTATEQITALRSQVVERDTSLAEQATALGQTRTQLTDTGAQLANARVQLAAASAEAHAATAQGETDAATIRQLRTELAMAGRRITSLRAQVSEQGTCLQDLCTELDQAHAELAKARAQIHAVTVRAEIAESTLAGIRQLIQTALTGDVPAAPPAEPDHVAGPAREPVEPVMCEGGCGMPVDPAYVQSTKRRWHGGHCADLAAAAAERSSGRRAVA
jgi:hypothetical protein